MAFEKFTHYRNSNKNALSLRSNGTLFIRDAMLDKYGGKDCDVVEIYIDEDNYNIGVKLLNTKNMNDKTKNIRRLSVEKFGKHFNIKKVLKYFGITHVGNVKTLVIDDEASESENMIVIDIKQLTNKKK